MLGTEAVWGSLQETRGAQRGTLSLGPGARRAQEGAQQAESTPDHAASAGQGLPASADQEGGPTLPGRDAEQPVRPEADAGQPSGREFRGTPWGSGLGRTAVAQG